MHVVVIGTSGLVGRYLLEQLLQHGHTATGVDRVRPEHDIAPYRIADLEDLGQVYDVFMGAEAVVHLVALHLGLQGGEVVFRTNVVTTFNVLEAATNLGIPRAVFASSLSALGDPAFYQRFAPQSVPRRRGTTPVAQDPYALSKIVNEESGQAFARRTLRWDVPGYGPDALEARTSMTIISIRPTWIVTPKSFRQHIVPIWEDAANGASVLWTYVDVRDVAQAFRLALQADLSGYETFIATAPNTYVKLPSAELLQEFYPETEMRSELEGNQSLVSAAKATRLLGYQAEYTWETYFD